MANSSMGRKAGGMGIGVDSSNAGVGGSAETVLGAAARQTAKAIYQAAIGSSRRRRGSRGMNLEDLERRQMFAANLQVVAGAMVPSGPAKPGQSVAISWTDQNVGDAVAANSYVWDRVVFSVDDVWGNSDDRYLVVETRGPGQLTPGQTWQSGSRTVTIPADAYPGAAHILFKVDAYDNQAESNENDNVRAMPITVADPQVDLAATPNAQTPSSVTMKPGQEGFSIGFTVTNLGASPTGNLGWYDYVYISDDDTLDFSEDYGIAAWGFSGTLTAAGGGANSYDVNITFDVPTWMSVGTGKYLFLIANGSGDQSETDGATRTNNRIRLPLTVQQPDWNLVVDGAQVVDGNPADRPVLTPGQGYDVTYVAKNAGLDNLPWFSWRDAIYFSADPFLDENDTLLDTLYQDHSLAGAGGAGGSYDDWFNIRIPAGLHVGDGYLIIAVDRSGLGGGEGGPSLVPAAVADEGSVSESNEGDNTFLIPVTIAPYNVDLQVLGVTVAPTSGQIGSPARFSATFHGVNHGTTGTSGPVQFAVYLSSDGTVNGAAYWIGSGWLDDIAAGAEWEVTAEDLQMPSVFNQLDPNEPWHLVFVADPYFRLEETDYDNNSVSAPFDLLPPDLDLTVDSITAPAVVQVDTDISISWVVKNLGQWDSPTGKWYDIIWLSVDDKIDSSDRMLYSWSHTGGLAGQGEYTGSLSWLDIPWDVAAGSYNLIIQTNSGSQWGSWKYLTDANAANDALVVPIKLILPDLSVTEAGVDVTEANLGDTVTVNWTVRNEAEAPTYWGWYDTVYISSDPVFDDNDVWLGDQWRYAAPSLPTGGTYSGSRSVTIPTSVGRYGLQYLIVRNQGEDGNDANYADNYKAIPIYIHGGDLVIVNPTITPANAGPGAAATVTFTVRNDGDRELFRPSGGWRDGIYFSKDGKLDLFGTNADTWFATQTTTGPASLKPGESYDVTISVTLPSNMGSNFFVLAVADSATAVREAGEGNNVAALEVGGNLPDLSVTGLSTNVSTGIVGQTIEVTWTVSNLGVAGANADWWDSFYLSTDETLSANDILVGNFGMADFSPLPGTTGVYTLTRTLTIPRALVGQYYLIAATDYAGHGDSKNNAQSETNEGNNTRAVPLTVKAADLAVQSISAPATVASTSTGVGISWTVVNLTPDAGTSATAWYDSVFLSTDPFYSGNDILLSSFLRSGDLAGGGTYTLDRTIDIPKLGSGKYYLVVVTDQRGHGQNGSDAQGEVNEINNQASFEINITAPDLTVPTASAPVSAVLNQTITVTWTVANANGNAGVSKWYDGVFLSNDNQFDGGDVWLGALYWIDGIAANGSYQRTLQVTIPATLGIGGKFLIFAADTWASPADAGNRQGEDSETNNFKVLPIQLDTTNLVSSLPTATAGGMNPVPGEGAPRQPYTFSWTVKNTGGTPALYNWYDRVYLSKDDSWDLGDKLVGTYDATVHTGLAPDGSYVATVTAYLPDVEAGEWKLLFVADATGVQPETSESDNTVVLPITIKAPNLVVQNLTVNPANPQSGGQVTVSYDIVNIGGGTAYGSPTTGWFDRVSIFNLDTNQELRVASVSHQADGPLAAGDARHRTVTFTLQHGQIAAGRLEIRVVADASTSSTANPGQVYEYNANGTPAENDNTATARVDSTLSAYPDLVVVNPSITGASGPLTSGQSAVIRWTVRNNGNAAATGYWRDNIVLTNLDTGETFFYELRTSNNSLPGNGGEVQSEVTINLPHGARGTGQFRVTIQADADNHVFEATTAGNAEQNNSATANATSVMAKYPDLRVSDVLLPANARSGGPVAVTWTITNHGEGDATGTWVDQVFLSDNDSIGNDGGVYGSFTFTGTIPAGGSVTRTQIINLPVTLEGAFWAVVKTDSYDTLRDYPDDNNTGISLAPMQVALRQFPNLIVERITVPPSAFSGQKTVIKWRVQNTGDGATAGTWLDAIYLSSDAEYQTQDVLLGRVGNLTALRSGEMYENEFEFTLPEGISGSWYVIVRTDSENSQMEPGNEADNRKVSPALNVTLTPPADLQVVGHTFGSAFLFSGQTLPVTWTVRNVGLGPAPVLAWDDAVYLSDDAELDANDLRLTTFRHAGDLLASGGQYIGKGTITLPVGVTGVKYILFRADYKNDAFESAFENNNVRPVEVNIALTPPPDLEVTHLETVTPVLSGRKLTVRYEVTNNGLTAVPDAQFWDQFFLSVDDKLDLDDKGNPINGDIRLLDRIRGGAHAAGAATVEDVELELSRWLAAGNYYLIAKTDAKGTVFEADDTNNVRVLPIAVGTDRPNIRVTAVSAPAVGVINNAFPVRITLRNDGSGATYLGAEYHISLWLRDGANPGVGDVVLRGTVRGVTLQPGEEVTIDGSVQTDGLFLAPGNYQLYAKADHYDNQPESNENDNVSPARPITMIVRQPNLVLSDPFGPNSVDADAPLTIRWKTSNTGDANAVGLFRDAVYLSRDGKLDRNTDILLNPIALEGSLAMGEVRDITHTLNLPITASGNYYLIIVGDFEGAIAEGNESDNVITLPINVRPYVAPDLRVTNVSAPTEAYSGRQLNVSWTVVNGGGPVKDRIDGRPQYWTDTVYLSADGVFDPTLDRVIGNVSRNGPLAANGSYSAGGLFEIPADWSGPSYIFVVTDRGLTIYEGESGSTGESNNVSPNPAPVLVTATPPTDLVAQPFTVPASGMLGRQVTITFTIKNAGDRPALGSWYDSLYLSADGQWDINDPLITRAQHVGTVVAGDSYTVTVTATLPGVVPGDYHVIVRSDILDHVPEGEAGEANNITASITRIQADAEALPLNGTAAGEFGQGIASYYKLSIPAGATGETVRLFLNSVAQQGAVELYVAYGRMPSRVDFDFRNIEAADPDVSATIPFSKAGEYYILAYGQGLPLENSGQPAKITFDLSAQVIPFGVTSVDATQVGNTGLTTLRLRGARFDGATQFALVGPAGLVVSAATVRFEDAALAYATFDLTGLPTGKYSIRAIDSRNVVSTLADALDVNDAFGGRHAVSFESPNNVRGVFPILVSWGNDGGTDLPAPLIIVTNNLGLDMGFAPNRLGGAGTLSFFGASHDGPAGILRAGEAYSLALFSNSLPNNVATYKTYAVRADDPRALDLDYLRSQLPDNVIADPNFGAIWTGIVAAVGPTWGSYVRTLAQLANQVTERLGNPHQPRTMLGLLADKVRASLTSSIQGAASSTDLGVPVANRLVTARNLDTGEQFATYTLADGRFIFTHVTPGTYAFAVQGAVLAGATAAVVSPETPLTGAQLTLAAGARVAGSVRNAAGTALANARVTLTNGDHSYATVTDDAGNYVLDGVLPGVYTLIAEADGMARGRVDGLDIQTAAVARSFTLGAESRVSGTVGSASAGDPLATFTVTAVRRNAGTTSNPDVYSVTVPAGAFSLGNLPAGTYDITVRRAGFGPQTLVVTIAAGGTEDVGTVTLGTGAKVTGSVVSEMPGVGVLGLAVTAYNAANQPVATAFLTPAGGFSFADLAPGTYTFRVQGLLNGFGTTQTLTVAGNETASGVTLRVVAGASITGSLGSTAAGGITVIATRASDGVVFAAVASADGTYRIAGLQPGTYSVGVPGATVFQTITVVALSDEAHTANFAVATGTQISGLVLDAAGQPIPGARVILLSNGIPVATAGVNDNGAYAFTLWQPGVYTFQVEALDATFPEAVVTLTAGQPLTQVFRAGTGVAHVNVQGAAVAGSVVRLYQILSDGTRRLAGEVTLGTASDGHAQFGRLTAGQYVAEVTGPNNTGGSSSFTVGTATAATANVSLTNLGQVGGNVTADGQAVAGARVLALDPTTHKIVGVAVTDADGDYTLTGLAAGTYEVVVLQTGHIPAIFTATVAAGGTASQNVTLVAGGPTVTGRVVDAQGNPVAGAGVTILDAEGRIVGFATTNPDGTFTIVGALNGVTLQTAAPGGPTSQVTLAGGALAGSATANAGDVFAQVLGIGRNVPAVAAAEAAFAQIRAMFATLDIEMPQWLQIMWDNLSEGYERDPNEATFGQLIPISEDCIDECGELLARAVREINMQDYQYKRVVELQEGLSLSAKTTMALMIAEPLFVLGQIAAAILAVKGLIVAAGFGFAAEGGLAVTYGLTQLLSNMLGICDFIQQAMSASKPEDALQPLEQAGNFMSNFFGLLSGYTEQILTMAKSNPSLPNFMGGVGNAFNIVGIISSLRDTWKHTTFEDTRNGIEDLIHLDKLFQKAKEDYKHQIAVAHEAVEAYNRCMEACERDEDPDNNGQPPAPPDGPGDDEDDVRMPASRDPNDILGPAGYGDQNWTSAPIGKALGYTIRFENAADATAPAQVVTITQRLDADLDWRTFRIEGFGFGDFNVTLPGDRGFHVQRLDLRDVFGVFVDFSATVDPATGTVTFRFVAIDPATGDVPTDPTKGFLPPDDGEGIGQGYVRYSVKPKATAVTGAVIEASATIVFDENEAIETPAIFNTLDRRAPDSSVVALPPNSSGVIHVKWAGSDNEQADGESLPTSGLTRFDIYVRVDGGQWALWLENTELIEADYLATAGHTYMFYSVAKDLAGNVESAPVVADATTTVTTPNTTPTIELGGDGTQVDEGSVFSQTGSFADPDLDDAWTATVNYGDGTGDQPLFLRPDGTFDLSHAYADNGDYVVTVNVTDSKGAFATRTIGVTSRNVAPTLDVIADVTLPFGQTFGASAHFIDPGTADTHTATVNYGDGTGDHPLAIGPGGTFVLDRTFAAPGTYTVTVTVTDDDGGVATQSLTVHVQAPPPVLAQPVKVNDGHAQRSDVRTITLIFDQAVNFDPAAFVLKKRNGTTVPLTVTASADRKTLTLSFASLADGVYDLTVAPTGVWNDDGIAATQGVAFSFHRLYGDVDGDGRITTVDTTAARTALNATAGSAKYVAYLDLDNDGIIENSEYNDIRSRLGTNVFN